MEKSGHEQLTTAEGTSSLERNLSQPRTHAELNGNDRDLLATVSELQTVEEPPRAADVFNQIKDDRGGITRPTAYKRLGELSECGLLDRQENGDDKREVTYTTTDKGNRVLDDLYNQYLQVTSLRTDSDRY
jgi:DNA-binding PadR family transcriptional regulator